MTASGGPRPTRSLWSLLCEFFAFSLRSLAPDLGWLQEEGHEIAFVGFMEYELNTVGVVPCGDDPTELCTADSAGNVVSFVDLDTVLTCNGGQFLPPDTGAGDQSNQSVGGAVQSWGQQYENLQLYPPPGICIWNGEL